MIPEVPLKATKKAFPVEAFDEVKPPREAVRGATTAVSPPRSQGVPLAGFVAAHHGLIALLPPAIQTMVPKLPPESAIVPERCDYSTLIDWLRLPRFGAQDTACNWVKHFAPSLPVVKHRIVDRLAELVELGAVPQDRQLDLFFAWWELEFMRLEEGGRMPILARRCDDGEPAMTVEQVNRLASQPKVVEAIRAFAQGASNVRAGGWNQRSVMKLLGYAVGWSGPLKDKRRAALEACMVVPVSVLPDSQLQFWGARASKRRARAIARMIKLFVSLSERRTHGDWSKACADWSADLKWVGESWPAAVV